MKKSGIIATFVISLLTVPLYIYSFENNLWIFWVVFILDRIISPILGPLFDKSLDSVNLEPDTDNQFTALGRFVVIIILLCVVGVGMMIYVLFRSPKLFIILMLGELLDKIANKYIIKKS
ncbi:MAG: hypothetical protein ACRC3Y_12625 [Romboutsia sp.]|uniref:hypothetical protein n=1 Tax=Romboutsia sp. TaxID=1965302 RepID=UPI003F36CB89